MKKLWSQLSFDEMCKEIADMSGQTIESVKDWVKYTHTLLDTSVMSILNSTLATLYINKHRGSSGDLEEMLRIHQLTEDGHPAEDIICEILGADTLVNILNERAK